ncbi:MAG: hypothetical protein M3Q71_21840 [Chloroflexota bacterium]|nr:hypothetical protein [Chloroflexota bacterium]
MSRKLTRLFALMSLTLALVSGVLTVGAQREASLASDGALGMPRTEIEAEWGQATEPIDVPGHPIYDETYAYPAKDGTLFVTYRDLNGDDIAVYVEFAWSGGGATEQSAQALTKRLLPADAAPTEFYVAPPTSAGPIALVNHRYESDALGANPALPPDILVTYQERWGDSVAPDSTRVEAVSLMIREGTQVTG